jgi:hypothetical protein
MVRTVRQLPFPITQRPRKAKSMIQKNLVQVTTLTLLENKKARLAITIRSGRRMVLTQVSLGVDFILGYEADEIRLVPYGAIDLMELDQ